MRQYTRYITLLATLLLSATTWAGGEFTYIYKLNGSSSNKEAAGTITGKISENKATLTLTPADGNFITAENITVVKNLSGSHAQTRIGISENVAITPTNANADPSGTTTYEFDVTDENYDYEVTADFQARTSISGAIIALEATSYTYDGKEHKPGVSSVTLSGKTLKVNDNYTIEYGNDCTNAGEKTVTIKGCGIYSGSETAKFNIDKAEAGLAFSVSEDEKVFATIGESFTEPTLTNPHNLSITWDSLDKSVATVDNEGKVTLISAGLTYISATFAGNDNYKEQSVKYQLRVKGKYNLWIDNIQVTSDNYSDVLNDGKNGFFYDLVRKWLIITNNETPVAIKSQMPELTIYLNGDSKLDRIYFDNQGNTENTGTLVITTYTNIPGTLALDTNHEDGVISGFSSFTIDENTNLCIQEPEGAVYEGGKLLKATGGEVAKEAAIGQYIEPMTNGETVNVGQGMDENTDITNTVVDGTILITGVQHVEDTDENDDYAEGGAIVLNNTNTSENVEQISQDVENGNIIPGTDEYAQNFQGGLTFLVPSGEGVIELEVQTEPGYMLMLKIGTSAPHEITEDERAVVTINYDVAEPTYVYVYLQEKPAESHNSKGHTRVGKRDKVHGRVYSINVSPSKVAATNPLSDVEGVDENDISIPEVVTTNGSDTPTKIDSKPVIIVTEATANGKWYTIEGQQINKPTQKGLYIKNRKKVVIR